MSNVATLRTIEQHALVIQLRAEIELLKQENADLISRHTDEQIEMMEEMIRTNDKLIATQDEMFALLDKLEELKKSPGQAVPALAHVR
jgi:hypothetical protein